MNKKGAMELSVTAIVILILAIVMLGLGLGFIRGMFSKVSTNFDEMISAEPEAPDPSGSEPITLSRENLIVNSGNQIALKVGIQNVGDVDWTNANLTITCSGTTSLVTEERFNGKPLNSGEFLKSTYLFKVGKITDKTYLCQAKVQHTPLNGANSTKDMTIKVTK